MMSFRHASDYTYIAQLLGRMIRTPLARRIESDAELNNVGLFLPFFDEKTVEMVEKALRENEVVPAETGSHKELLTLIRNPEFENVFNNMRLITYRIDAARKQSSLRRLIALARALMLDDIASDVRKNTLNKMLDQFEQEVAALKSSEKFDEIDKVATELAIRTLTIDYGKEASSDADRAAKVRELNEFDFNNLFERAGKVLGEGLHNEYWGRHLKRDAEEVKTEIIILTNDIEAMERIESFAEKLFHELYELHKRAFRDLSEERNIVYKKLAMSSPQSIPLDWELHESIDFSLGKDAKPYDKHLFIPSEGGGFKTSLNEWEDGVLREELKRDSFVAWLRNLDRKKWSLEIPYKTAGVTKPMFPDLIVVRNDARGYIFDILEPHDPSRDDNYPKAVGLAEFAEKHGEYFGRIQLIRKERGADKRDHYYRLDMGLLNIRNQVRGITSNAELDRIFAEDAVTEE
jgi:type III restriction enzyme